MTISKGTEWGRPGQLPENAPVFGDDAELLRFVNRSRSAGEAPGVVGLTGGTLWHMIGGPSAIGRLHTPDARIYRCDLGRVETDGGTFWFAASLVARTRTWSRALVVMNAQNVGAYRFGHRAHPNDGLLDIYESELSWQQRLLVAKRARLGAHLPHPGIQERRAASATVVMPGRVGFRLDGVPSGRSRTFSVCVEPDALTLVI